MKRLAILALLLAGCANTTDPIITEVVCMKWSYQTTIATTVVSNGNGGLQTVVTPVTTSHCDRTVAIVYPNPDYKEPGHGR